MKAQQEKKKKFIWFLKSQWEDLDSAVSSAE